MTAEFAAFSTLIEKLYKGPLEQRSWSSFLEALLTEIPSTFIYLGLAPTHAGPPLYKASAGDVADEKTYSPADPGILCPGRR